MVLMCILSLAIAGVIDPSDANAGTVGASQFSFRQFGHTLKGTIIGETKFCGLWRVKKKKPFNPQFYVYFALNFLSF